MESQKCHDVVEAQGHLIDSHIMEQIFDTVVEYDGRFEVEKFRIGRTNADASHLRLRVETPSAEQMEQLLGAAARAGLHAGGCGEMPRLRTVEQDCCAPEDFYSTTNHRTLVRHGGEWLEVQNQRMDALVVLRDGQGVVPQAARPARGRSRWWSACAASA